MFSKQRFALLSAAAVTLAVSGIGLTASVGTAADVTAAPLLSYDSTALEAEITPAVAAVDADPAEAPVQNTAAMNQVAEADAIDPAELQCMAKVVMHESRGQPRAGQIAVAQTLVNRMKRGGRFGDSICEVAKQPGQFFNIASYRPDRDSDDWATAMEVSRSVLSGDAEAVAPGALFFRAAYAAPNSFFRTRQRVASVGGQVFYR